MYLFFHHVLLPLHDIEPGSQKTGPKNGTKNGSQNGNQGPGNGVMSVFVDVSPAGSVFTIHGLHERSPLIKVKQLQDKHPRPGFWGGPQKTNPGRGSRGGGPKQGSRNGSKKTTSRSGTKTGSPGPENGVMSVFVDVFPVISGPGRRN